MGCQTSKQDGLDDLGQEDEDKEIRDFLSPQEVELVRSSWGIVKKDIPGTGIYMFTRLFELQTDFKKFFKRLMTQKESGEYDLDWNKLGNHANIVMNALDNAVDSLDDSSFLSKGLVDLGGRHATYKVKPEMVPLMWPAVRDALKQALADDFSVQTELAWKHVFDYIVSKLAQGMRKPHHISTAANGSTL